VNALDIHDRQWRKPSDVVGWRVTRGSDKELLRYRTSGHWWEAVSAAGVTLLVTREMEHLAQAIRVVDDRPDVSYVRLPHPSGIAVDRARHVVHIASTRNPNQIFDFEPCELPAHAGTSGGGLPLLPVRTRFYAGSLYIHDLAMIGATLHANAVGQNSIARLDADASYERVWWPRVIDTDAGPLVWRNHLQLNSIAAGPTVEGSYFSASTHAVTRRRPGHLNFAVDGRGVIFSGETREPVVTGLTRPHSARFRDRDLWVDNSGYGTVGVCEGGHLNVVAKLPGWTRGLTFAGRIAFVGTSRVIPRFHRYAPGLDVSSSVCGIHAIDAISGQILGSLTWPAGDQIFAIDWLEPHFASGFPLRGTTTDAMERTVFYSFRPHSSRNTPSASPARRA
jgi:uncharacterized protein (TIGR03032 family)